MKLKKLKEKMPKSFMGWLEYFLLFLAILLLLYIVLHIVLLVAVSVRYLFLPKEVKLYEKAISSISEGERVEALKFFNESLEIDPEY